MYKVQDTFAYDGHIPLKSHIHIFFTKNRSLGPRRRPLGSLNYQFSLLSLQYLRIDGFSIIYGGIIRSNDGLWVW